MGRVVLAGDTEPTGDTATATTHSCFVYVSVLYKTLVTAAMDDQWP